MEYKQAELVVFLQDSNHQVFKDICMDEEECSLENCKAATGNSRDVPKRQSLERELVDQKENQDQELKPVSMASKFVSKEASCGKGRIADSISTEGSVPNIKAEKSTSTEDATARSLASLFANQNAEKLPDSEDMNPVVSGTKQCHDTISIHSTSTNSTKSFAFPVLTSEWTGSPVKMVEADKRDFKRRSCCWRMCFDFCRF